MILNKLKVFPAVALLGARQSGKTTLAKTFSSIYYDLELEEDRLRLDLQWNSIIAAKELIILLKAQVQFVQISKSFLPIWQSDKEWVLIRKQDRYGKAVQRKKDCKSNGASKESTGMMEEWSDGVNECGLWILRHSVEHYCPKQRLLTILGSSDSV